ncbi:MAG TPA: ABC-2 transporter permease [Pseudoflavonifractor sp.]|nr:ABC-2 transporter permease [Pseudoflavonifractor sp.]
MKNLLYKELRLSLHPTNVLFFFFAALIFIPGYPYQMAAFFTCLGLNSLCVSGRENSDIFYTALLPARKGDIVRARFALTSLLQLGQMALMLPLIALRDAFIPLDNPAGLEANPALIGLCLITFGAFNFVFFTLYYKDPRKIGLPFIFGCIPVFLLISLEVAATYAIPFVRDKLDTRGLLFLPEKLSVLAVGAVFYFTLTLLACRKSVKSFEKLDL